MSRVAVALLCAGVLACSGGDASGPPHGPVRGGTLIVSISGLPDGVDADVYVTGDKGTTHTLGATRKLTDLTPGRYTIVAREVSTAAYLYISYDTLQVVSVSPTAAAAVLVAYQLGSGSLRVDARLPAGAPPAPILIIGPRDVQIRSTTGTLLRLLRPGTYQVYPESFIHEGDRYGPETLPNINVYADTLLKIATVDYRVVSARMIVNVSGLPNGVRHNAIATNYNGEVRQIESGQTLSYLNPAELWEVRADTVVANGRNYVPLLMVQRPPLAVSPQPTVVVVQYVIPNGTLILEAAGLASGIRAPVFLTGPNRFERWIRIDTTFTDLTPGSYTLQLDGFEASPDHYRPKAYFISTQVDNVSPKRLSVPFDRLTRYVQINISGLPPGMAAPVKMYGPLYPSGLAIPKSTLLGPFPGGDYTILAPAVELGHEGYLAVREGTGVAMVAAERPQEIDIVYVNNGPMNISIGPPRVMQQTYRLDASLPLVAGRDAIITGTASANRRNGAYAPVRVRVYHGANLVHSFAVPPPTPTVPWPSGPPDTDVLGWYTARIPGQFVQTGLGVIVDIDTTNAYHESVESDNVWPRSQTPLPIRVENVAPLSLTFVPLVQSANGGVGDVSAANIGDYSAVTRKMLPLGDITISVRAPFTLTGTLLKQDNSDDSWVNAASQLAALHAVEGATSYYYGVVKTGYTSGVAGIGQVAGRVALGWDLLPSASVIMAHELGHNFGLLHSPCGATADMDPAFPYGDGRIGFGGYDLTTSRAIGGGTPDFMGYCADAWISDYAYERIVGKLRSNEMATLAAVRSEPGLLVWGRIVDGQPVLEPVFEVHSKATAFSGSGQFRLEAFAPNGESLFSFAFDAARLDHGNRDSRVFAFVLPQSWLRGRMLGALRLSANGRTSEQRAQAPSIAAQRIHVESLPREQRLIMSLDGRTRGLLLRDGRTGQVLAIGSGSSVTIRGQRDQVSVIWSDGIRSVTRRIDSR